MKFGFPENITVNGIEYKVKLTRLSKELAYAIKKEKDNDRIYFENGQFMGTYKVAVKSSKIKDHDKNGKPYIKTSYAIYTGYVPNDKFVYTKK